MGYEEVRSYVELGSLALTIPLLVLCSVVVYGVYIQGLYNGGVWWVGLDERSRCAAQHSAHASCCAAVQHAQVTALIVFGICHRLDAARQWGSNPRRRRAFITNVNST